MEPAHELEEESVICANLGHVDIFEAVNHAVLSVDGTPNLVSLKGSIGFFVFY